MGVIQKIHPMVKEKYSMYSLKLTAFMLLMVASATVWAQINYQEQYMYGKKLFSDGKYNLAMEVFKPLIAYDVNNSFSEYASFYYALSAYRQGYDAVAKDMLNQIRSLYPYWEKQDEVSLWLATIHFKKSEYSQGLHALSLVTNQRTVKDSELLKKNALTHVEDITLLKSLYQKYPTDEVIGERLAYVLAVNANSDQTLLEELIQKFHLKKSDFVEETPETIRRDVYSVSVVFPFVVNTLEPTPNRKRNQFVLDMYEGMKLAVDTLAKQGVNISLRAYDTERNVEKLKKILEKTELKNTDLIVGPVFQEENAVLQEFSKMYQVNAFNPLSNNIELVAKNPYGFLVQPSNESIGRHSAQYIAKNLINRKCIVFYGESKRDSILAANFVAEATAHGLRMMKVVRVSKDATKKISDILATPTEYDEFKYPKQFTLPKDSLGSVYVASDDPLIYTKVISSVETRGDQVTIMGFESWLDQSSVNYEKYERLNIVLAAPNFTTVTNAWYIAFQRKFIKVHGRSSNTAAYSNYAKLGYDFMLFAGYALKKHGVYFQNEVAKKPWVPGYLSEGYDYTRGRDNQQIPFVKFEGGKLSVVESF
jgi:hypothetical protein